ncbi:MAG: 1-acyl-sn-glycerol-3-phosphate acyltransferase [Candidatus Binatia bacterium]
MAEDIEETVTPQSGLRDRGLEELQVLFLRRLEELESRLDSSFGRAAGGGALLEFLGDAARELWLLSSGERSGRGGLADRRRRAIGALGTTAKVRSDPSRLLSALYGLWLGISSVEGEPLPDEGPVLVLVNRSSSLSPLEAMVVSSVLRLDREAERRVCALWAGRVPSLPWVGAFLRNAGVLPADPDSCSSLFEEGAVVIAFPEGAAAERRGYASRYKLERFERLATLRAAVDCGASVVPGALSGSEESFPLLGRIAGLPVTATFPWLGALGLVPLPVRWRLRLGATVDRGARADDEEGLAGFAEDIRVRVQTMLAEMVAERASILSG